MKKTFLLFTLLAGLCTALFAAPVSDVALYNEINLAFTNKYYPGTVDKAELLEKQYPDSVFVIPALAYKGDALINMYRYQEAIETLNRAISHMHTGSEEMAHCSYLLGKAYYFEKKYDQALENFHLACTLALTDNVMDYYNPSVLYAGRIYYLLEDYEQAVPLMEYVIANGNFYTSADYLEILQELMLSCNLGGKPEKTCSLYIQLDEQTFTQDFYSTLTLYYGDALKLLNNNKAAYDSYCKVIEGNNENLAIIALKKAYVLSSEKNIGVNPGEVFSKTVDTFSQSPELVNEFWIRLGIDEYKAGNYKKAEEYFASVENKDVVADFYKAKILIDRDKNFAEAEKQLLSIDTDVKNSLVENLSDSYYSLLLQCKYKLEKWNEIPSAFNKIKNPDANAVYALSAYYYNKGEYKKVNPDTGVLYASSLCKMGDYAGAVKVFSGLNLENKDCLEYAKALFACGRFEDAYVQAQKSNDLHKEYVSGLCQINLKNWTLAQTHFAGYIKQASVKPDFIKLVFFYKGYAEYCMEEYKNSYASFVRFGSEADSSLVKYSRAAYEYAAKSALQNGDFKSASIQAENVIRTSTTQDDKHNAVIFCAEIFSDYKSYDRALDILKPYLNEKSDFAVQAIFTSAKIYEKQDDVASADEFYKRIFNDYAKSSLAEEALFRTGELYYSHQEYGTSLNRFNSYIYKYVNGKFSDAAMFYGGDCALRLGELDRAIMLNRTMLQKYTGSIYTYGANKNLLAAYYQQESYNLALEVAKNIVKTFPQQAADDEIGRRLIELEKIVNGTDRQVAAKQSEYDKAGKSGTKKGRVIGSELVQLYAGSSDTQKEAFELALELLNRQKDEDERKYAAANAEFAADYYRRQQDNGNAAKMYLTAAEYFRSINDSVKAAAALYGAAEAFAADGYYGDAEETAKLLKQLYPESKQADRVDSLLRN